MKRKIESTITKRLPKLFTGKRTTSDRDEDRGDNNHEQLKAAPSVPNGDSETNSSSQPGQQQSIGKRVSKFLSASLEPRDESKKRTGNAPPVNFEEGQQPIKEQPAKEPPKEQRRTFNVPPVSSFLPDFRESRKTANAAPVVFSGSGLDASKPLQVEPPMVSSGSIESLDDFSLRRLLDKRLFASENSTTETILVVRLSPITSVTSQLATSITKVLNKDDKKKREVLLAFTRLPEIYLHGITSNASAILGISWSFSLKSLLAMRELKRGLVVLQFQGGKERKIYPVSEMEKAWLFYCVMRLSREHARCEPTVIALSTMRVATNEDVINARCPFLLKTTMGERRPSSLVTKARVDGAKRTEVSFGTAAEWFEDLGTGEEDQMVAETFRVMRKEKRASLMMTDDDSETVDRVLQPRFEKESVGEIVSRTRVALTKLENETLNELRAWESGAGPVLTKKSLVDLDHGRKGDPVASLLAHLESVDASLAELEVWMNEHDASILNMTLVARKIDGEIRGMREDGQAKEKLRAALEELLHDVSSEDDKVLNDLPNILPIVQRELESFQKQKPFTTNLLRACRSLIELRNRGGQDSKLAARRERYQKLSERVQLVGFKLAEFTQSRVDYYYRFERSDVREAHGRLATYAEIVACLHALSPTHSALFNQRYQQESGAFVKGELARILTEPFFATAASLPCDSIAKYVDANVFDSSDVVRVERELALKEVHMPGVETRRRFFMRMRSLIDEEQAFCTTMGAVQLDFAPGLALALEGIWTMINQKAIMCPVSIAAPLVSDSLRFASQLKKDGKDEFGVVVTNKLVAPLKECLDRFVVDQVGTYLEKAKRSQQLFVRRVPSVIDKLWAASRGFSLTPDDADFVCPGVKIVVETALQLIATVQNSFARAENLFVIAKALELRSDVPGLTRLDVDAKVDLAMQEAAASLIGSTSFAPVFRLSRATEEDETALTRNSLGEALGPLQQVGGLEKAVAQCCSLLESRITLPRVRKLLFETAQSSILDTYWRLAEDAAELLGQSIAPSATAVRDILNKQVFA